MFNSPLQLLEDQTQASITGDVNVHTTSHTHLVANDVAAVVVAVEVVIADGSPGAAVEDTDQVGDVRVLHI